MDSIGKQVVHRKRNFSVEEDIQLSHLYLEISQDPIEGTNQRKDKVWERIADLWNQGKPESHIRTAKSLQSRFVDLSYCVSKYRGAIRQVENRNPSGASEKDILAEGKQYLQNDPTYKKKKFQFDHVWHILKDAEKWTDNGMCSTKPRRRNDSSGGYESGSRTSQSSSAPSIAVDLNADEDEQELFNDEFPTSHRPMGVKKAKLKRKEFNEKSKIAEQIEEDNQRLKELFEKSLSKRSIFSAKHEQYVTQKLAIQRQQEERKIMLTNLDTISDETDREYLRMRKAEIMEIRTRESQLQQSPSAFGYGNFNNLNQFQGGSQVNFNSSNFFGNPLQFPSGFGESGGYEGVPHYRTSGGSGTSGGHGSNVGDGRNDDSLPEY